MRACLHNRQFAYRCPRARVRGFTAIELMVVVSIFGVLAAIAGPSFTTLIANQRAGTSATDLQIALIKTRSEATKRNANVWLCPKTASATEWNIGWQIQASDCSTVATTALDNHSPVSGTSISGPAAGVKYGSSGRVQAGSAPAFSVTGGTSSSQKYLCVDLNGRPLVQTSSCS